MGVRVLTSDDDSGATSCGGCRRVVGKITSWLSLPMSTDPSGAQAVVDTAQNAKTIAEMRTQRMFIVAQSAHSRAASTKITVMCVMTTVVPTGCACERVSGARRAPGSAVCTTSAISPQDASL